MSHPQRRPAPFFRDKPFQAIGLSQRPKALLCISGRRLFPSTPPLRVHHKNKKEPAGGRECSAMKAERWFQSSQESSCYFLLTVIPWRAREGPQPFLSEAPVAASGFNQHHERESLTMDGCSRTSAPSGRKPGTRPKTNAFRPRSGTAPPDPCSPGRLEGCRRAEANGVNEMLRGI